MKRLPIDIINNYLYRFFLRIMDSREATAFSDKLAPLVAKDIEETAGKDFNDSDIHIGLTRVLKEKLDIEV